MYKNLNDYEQLYLVCENDEYAKEKIFNKYKPIIVSIAKKYLAYSNNRFDLDDLIQEGYIGLNRAISSFDDKENVLFYTFSIVCIERQIKSYYRQFRTLKNYHFYNSYSLDMEIDDMTLSDIVEDKSILNSPTLFLDNSCLEEELINFKHSLDFRTSLVFELRYNGFKYREIADLLDISIGIVDSSIHNCKERLKKFLKLS